MTTHLLQHSVGLAHLVTAVLALTVGTLIIFLRKGTRRHKSLGRVYLAMMLALNVTALLIYELFGNFGVFHWMALLSLATVLGGYMPALKRKPGWKVQHAYFMSGSYVGLVAALAAEILSRTPWLPFSGSVALASFTVIFVGIALMFRFIPRLL